MLIPERDRPTGVGEHHRVRKGVRPPVGVAIAWHFQAQTRLPARRSWGRAPMRALPDQPGLAPSPAPDLDGATPQALH